MNGKVRIKFGAMEIDFEGSEQFLKDEFLEMITTIYGLAKESGVDLFQNSIRQSETNSFVNSIGTIGMNTVAQKLLANNGPSLTLAAAVKLDVVDKKSKFTSKEILAEMRKATSYFKSSYSKNCATNISSLIKSGKLNDVGSGYYSIPATLKGELANKLK